MFHSDFNYNLEHNVNTDFAAQYSIACEWWTVDGCSSEWSAGQMLQPVYIHSGQILYRICQLQ